MTMQAAGVLLGAVLLVLCGLLAVPVAVLAAELIAAALARRPVIGAGERAARGPLAVLMPAHDEAAGIGAAIAAVRGQLAGGDRLLVVADNCSDATAAVAREAGAEVSERADPTRRGKGYALDHGARALAAAPPSVVIVVDADCIVQAGALECLAHAAEATRRPAQALYLMHAPAQASLKLRIAAFAWVVKNQARPDGLRRLGLPCQLVGSGMAFPWQLFARAQLASGHLVEDLQLGLELAIAGHAPGFCPGALVTSVFPADAGAQAGQRTRWEHGYLSVIARMGPRMAWQALAQGRLALAAMALDLCIPPLAALVASITVLWLAGLAIAVMGGPWLPAALAAGLLALLAAMLLLAWHGYGRGIVRLIELATAPAYVAGKLPMYLRMAWRKQTEWVRTRRDDGSS